MSGDLEGVIVIILRVILGVVGVGIVLWILLSVLRTVVIPRPERVALAGAVLSLVRLLGSVVLCFARSTTTRDRIRGAYGPISLITLPVVWSVAIVSGFALIFHALGTTPWQDTLSLSASSITTLGFVAPDNTIMRLVASVEALIGLGIVALMISFLPTIYSAFARREAAIAHLTVRAGDPPHPAPFLERAYAIGELGPEGGSRLKQRWTSWEEWFVDVGETHTTFPALVFFGSARGHRSWLNAAETALDTAALMHALGYGTTNAAHETMIRAGYLTLRDIGDFFEIEHDPRPSPTDPISIDREMFDELVGELDSLGLERTDDLDAAWQSFSGWRVNYDSVLTGLTEMIEAPPSHWERPPWRSQS